MTPSPESHRTLVCFAIPSHVQSNLSIVQTIQRRAKFTSRFTNVS